MFDRHATASVLFVFSLFAVPHAQAACRVDFQYPQEWNNGLTASVTLTNLGSDWSSWQAEWSMPNQQEITGLWNGRHVQSGDQVTVNNESWNGYVAQGDNVNFGFNGSHDGLNEVPYDVRVNGELCEGQAEPLPPEPVACEVEYRVREQWGNGATIDVSISNLGRELYDWEVTWSMPREQQITGLWNGSFQQSGAAVAVTPESWNRTVSTGSLLEFGFNLSHNGVNPSPIDISVDGTLCAGQAEEILLPPDTPNSLSIELVDNLSAQLNWQSVAGDPEEIELWRSIDNASWIQLTNLSGTATSYQDFDLTPGQSYRWRLRARNAAGASGYSATVTGQLRDYSQIATQTLADNCVVCHGPDGVSLADPMPTIAGFSATYLRNTLSDFANSGRYASVMDRIVAGYSETQLDALADHFAAKTFVANVQSADPTYQVLGAQLHDSRCAGCHGDDGANINGSGVRLAGQQRLYLESTLLDMAEGLSSAYPSGMLTQIQQVYAEHGSEGLTALAHFYAGGRYQAPEDNGDGDLTTAPNSPLGFAAQVISTGSVELAWVDNSNNETGFVIERSEGADWTPIADLSAGTQLVQDSSVHFGTTYQYQIAAYNNAGFSTVLSTSVSIPALEEFGSDRYQQLGCNTCHANDGSGGFSGVALNDFGSADLSYLIEIIETTMPVDDPGSCTGLCAESIANYLVTDLPTLGDGETIACDDSTPALPRTLRLLTRREYQNTVNDLFGLELDLSARLPIETRVHGYDNNSEHNRVTPTHFEIYLELAEEIAASALSQRKDQLLSCNQTDPGCAETFVREFGLQAFRRPLSEAEVADWLDAFVSRGFDDAMQWVINGMLVSPSFLYRSELGEDQGDGRYRLDAYELASALSYLFQGSMPDATLLQAAANGGLNSTAGLLAQASRLLNTSQAQERLGEFAGQWLLSSDPYQVPSKDQTLYPDFNVGIGQDMAQEIEHFFNYVAFESSGRFDELILADYVLANSSLADFYGLSGATGDTFQALAAPLGTRSGVLTLGGVMSRYANSDTSHPFKRGAFFLDRILCQDLPPVGNMGVQIPPVDPELTTRERFDIHSNSDLVCYECHKYLDGPGFAFENWDAVGRFRSTENGQPIDASGVLRGLEGFGSEGEYPINDLSDMSELVAYSDTAAQCLATQYYRFATGQDEKEVGSCGLESLINSYTANGYDIPTLLLGIVGTSDFIYRR